MKEREEMVQRIGETGKQNIAEIKGSEYFKKVMLSSVDYYKTIKRIGTNKSFFNLRTRREYVQYGKG